jgi:hypothetical protein
VTRACLVVGIAALTGAHAAGHLHAAPASEPDYLAFYNRGITFAEFLDRARARRDEWRQRYNDATVTPDLVTRMRALPERRLILAVAEDWCSDSVNTVPYVARLVDGAPERLSLRIIDSHAGGPVMNAHLTPDGRAATPTIVVLREDGEVLGSWVERPSTAQSWFLEQRKTVKHDPLHERLMNWYAEDAGRTTLAEMAALLER